MAAHALIHQKAICIQRDTVGVKQCRSSEQELPADVCPTQRDFPVGREAYVQLKIAAHLQAFSSEGGQVAAGQSHGRRLCLL
jgi:hypothetical protein